MNTHRGFIVKCSCGRVISQCRCICKDKHVETRLHPACGMEPLLAVPMKVPPTGDSSVKPSPMMEWYRAEVRARELVVKRAREWRTAYLAALDDDAVKPESVESDAGLMAYVRLAKTESDAADALLEALTDLDGHTPSLAAPFQSITAPVATSDPAGWAPRDRNGERLDVEETPGERIYSPSED